MAEATDTRIVYGARCTWWDTIDKVNKNRVGLPCCPHCRSVLFEMDSIEEFMGGAREHEKLGHPGHVEMVEWMRGRCFPTWEEALQRYKERGDQPCQQHSRST
jgi:hypothetical protein